MGGTYTYGKNSSCSAISSVTSKATCEAQHCYQCGSSQGGTYIWGYGLNYSNASNCTIYSAAKDKAACDAAKNGQTDNRCTGKDSAGRNYVAYSGMPTSWTKSSCNAMVKDGYCHVWDDTNNCCGVTAGNWCRSGGGGGGGTVPEPDPEPDPDNNVSKNPGTGEITIFIMWVLGLATIVYSIWYFKRIREN